MQVNDSRLFKAARRTIRAELTLILIIVLIATWSIYALYKFSVGGNDSIFGLSFSRSSSSSGQASAGGRQISLEGEKSLPDKELNYRRNMIEEILAGQRELHRFIEDDDNLAPVRLSKLSALNQSRNLESLVDSAAESKSAGHYGRYAPISRSHRSGPRVASNKLRLLASNDVDSSLNDRQPAESNTELSEAVPESTDEPETTTASPTVADDSASADEGHSEESPADEQSGNQDDSDQRQAEDSTGDAVDDEQVASARDQGKSIDEEVDRMTEPSLGVLSRLPEANMLQENYDKSLVQFDDSLSSGSGPSSTHHNKRTPIKPPGTDGLIARFESPLENSNKVSGGIRKQRSGQNNTDLQVDHNMRPLALDNTSSIAPIEEDKKYSIDRKGSYSRKSRAKRSMSSHKQNKKDDKLSVVGLESQSVVPASDSSNDKVYTDQTSNNTNRRSDDDYEGQDDTDGQGEDHGRATLDDLRSELDRIARDQARDEHQPNYHYISSNDSTLRKLLDHQRLLDDLRYSQLPKPYIPADEANNTRANEAAFEPVASGNSDHQTAGSLYTVDHGLLLYPSEDEEHYHKEKSSSMSKKKKKHDKMKHKKKSTVAMKKGGHKKKKHKKEEKKFLKEKKFKGAKKGKKVAKGKGGQGGKKGKKLYKDKGFKKKGFKNVYHKEEFGQKKSYFDEFRDKDFKKKWKKYDDKYNYAQMKKWQAKDVKGAKKMKDSGENHKKYDKSKWKKKYEKHSKEHKASSKKKKKKKVEHDFR